MQQVHKVLAARNPLAAAAAMQEVGVQLFQVLGQQSW
jgi:hypothetical protein